MKVQSFLSLIELLLVLLLERSIVNAGTFEFIREPSDATLNEGDELLLYCTVTPADPSLRYQWYKSDTVSTSPTRSDEGVSSLSGEDGSVLRYGSIATDQEGFYQCVVESDEYKIYSKLARIQVKYFIDPGNTIYSSESYKLNTDLVSLTCNVPKSSPKAPITWYKDDEVVADTRYTVIPELENNHYDTGTLNILNVAESDAGTYVCKTEWKDTEYVLNSYTITVKSGANTEESRASFMFPIGTQYADIVPGASVTLTCAGKGNPVPDVRWYKTESDGEKTEISKTDTNQLEDFNRRLIIGNVVESGDYVCSISNQFNGRTLIDYVSFFVIVATPEDTGIDIIQEPSPIHVLKPNMYTPFTLECSKRNNQKNLIMWLKDGESFETNRRSHIEEGTKFVESVVDGNVSETEVFYRNIINETPNEEDLGVYQCIIYNDENLEAVTSFVVLEEDSAAYTTSEKEPYYWVITDHLKVDEAEEACLDLYDAHLVSIMNEVENKEVLRLMRANQLESAWIGLTRENPDPIGLWIWTQPGDISTTYSNWELGKPDNKYGREEYAVMLNSTGQWTDVTKEEVRPAVCKKYQETCPSIDEYFGGDVRVRGWESTGDVYQVGQEVEVYCHWPVEEAQPSLVTCQLGGTFSPEMNCPHVESSSSRRTPSSLLLLLLLVLLSMRLR